MYKPSATRQGKGVYVCMAISYWIVHHYNVDMTRTSYSFKKKKIVDMKTFSTGNENDERKCGARKMSNMSRDGG